MLSDSFAAVRATVARYAGWSVSLLDTTTRPLTEPLGWRPSPAPRPTATKPVAPVTPPTTSTTTPTTVTTAPTPNAPAMVRTRTSPKAARVPTHEPHDGVPDRLYVARPRTDARRPGKLSYRYAEFRPGMEVPPGGFLARKSGRRYAAVAMST